MIKPLDFEEGVIYILPERPDWIYYKLGGYHEGKDTTDGFTFTMDESRLNESKYIAKQSVKADTLPYKYNEPQIMDDLQEYIDGTYSEHYAETSFQSTEVIIDSGHGEGFCVGNILKYANRYGRKEGRNRKDLFKILHYTIILIFIHDRREK